MFDFEGFARRRKNRVSSQHIRHVNLAEPVKG